MALTNGPSLAHNMELLRSHGITRDHELMTKVADGPWYYQQIDLGFNYRMTELQAALGLSQMSRLDDFLIRRQTLARRYDEQLSGLALSIPWQHTDVYSSFHLYVIRLSHKSRRTQVFDNLREKGIGVNVHYIPVHLQPYYQSMGFSEGDFPEAERYYSEAISLPLFPGMSEDEHTYVIRTLKEVLQQ